jgi:hypothetical protein
MKMANDAGKLSVLAYANAVLLNVRCIHAIPQWHVILVLPPWRAPKACESYAKGLMKVENTP